MVVPTAGLSPGHARRLHCQTSQTALQKAGPKQAEVPRRLTTAWAAPPRAPPGWAPLAAAGRIMVAGTHGSESPSPGKRPLIGSTDHRHGSTSATGPGSVQLGASRALLTGPPPGPEMPPALWRAGRVAEKEGCRYLAPPLHGIAALLHACVPAYRLVSQIGLLSVRARKHQRRPLAPERPIALGGAGRSVSNITRQLRRRALRPSFPSFFFLA